MKPPVPGSKEAQVKALREQRVSRRPRIGTVSRSTIAKTGTLLARPNLDAQEEIDRTAKAAKPKESNVKKPKKQKAKTKKKATPKRGVSEAAANLKAAKSAAKKPARNGTVSAQHVADFVSRSGGASMAELVAEFGIEAHPMRAKIFAVRHTLGYAVETKDGRYYGTAPSAS